MTAAEQKLVAAARNDDDAGDLPVTAGTYVPSKGAEWGAERAIHAEVIYALATASNPAWPVRASGIWVKGARIIGSLDFFAAQIKFQLVLLNCCFEQEVVLQLASAPVIALTGSYLHDGMLADDLTAHGGVFLGQGFSAKGEVRLLGAKIDGQLGYSGSTFDSGKVDKGGNPAGDARTIQSATINGLLFLDGLSAKPRGTVNLSHAEVGVLVDDEKSWPEPGKLLLDGFRYGAIAGTSPRDAKSRIKWIELQPDDRFSFQPYEQLATALRRTGDEAGARKVLIAKNKALRKRGELGWGGRLANWFFYLTVGYGYRAWRALLWAAAIVFVGWLAFGCTKSSGVLVALRAEAALALPSRKSPPQFHSSLYSLDVFLPAPDLNQKKA